MNQEISGRLRVPVDVGLQSVVSDGPDDDGLRVSNTERGPMTVRSFKILRREHIVFTLTVAAFLTYAAVYIYRTSFVIHGQRYFSLFDDAMISMRYAKNLAHGHGLVWNPGGERVEGYTDPLWVLYMALVHLFPIPQSKTSLVIQISAAIFLAVNLYFVRKIALFVSDGSESVALGAAVLTASYLPINFWSLQGMEVSVAVLLTSVCLWQALTCMRDKTFSVWLYVLLGVGTWVRPDMVVTFAAFILFLAAFDPIHRWKHAVLGSVILLSFGAIQTAFRLWYFGNIFPNTYYLKLTGYPFALRVSQGFYVLAKFMWRTNLLLFAIPFTLGAVRRDRRISLLLWVLIVQMMYSVYVGGDAWEYWGGSNRYISIAMPGFFILLSYGLLRIVQTIIDVVPPEPRAAGATTAPWKMCVFPLLIVFSVVSVNSIHRDDALAELLLLKAPLHTGSGDENQADVEEALLIREITTPEAKILVGRAGTIPYFSDRYSIDFLGKADRYIAHEPMRTEAHGLARLTEFRPGHMKYDYGYSIGQLEPDMIAFELFQHQEWARPYLQGHYTQVRLQGKCLYLQKNSSNVLWKRLPVDDGSNTCATE
jgi:hypothetical protein